MDSDETEIDVNREPSFKNIFNKYVNKIVASIVIIIIVSYIYIQIALASTDDKSFTRNFNYNIFAIIVPIIGILCFIMLSSTGKEFGMFVIVATIFAISVFGVTFYFFQTTFSTFIFNQYLLYFVIALSIIVGFAIVATLLSGTLRKQVGWTGFIANLVFYIPCLIRDGIKGAVNEYKTFSTTLFVLFFVELLLLLMYFFLIPVINKNSVPENISLLGDPVMLNTVTPLSVAPIYTVDMSLNKPWNNFALSMWIYVNPAPNTKIDYTRQTPIFTYSPSTTDNYFTLNYLNDTQRQTLFNLDIANTNMSTIFSDQNPIPIDMPLQKWNNVIFNVITTAIPVSTSNTKSPGTTTSPVPLPTTTTKIDVFINGQLVQSCPLKSTPKFSPSDLIKVGNGNIDENMHGLYGAVCNVVYYRTPLSHLSLIYNYNKLVINNPPV